MYCKYSRNPAHDFDACAECTCIKWFRRICGICLLVCIVLVTCCIYCTMILLRIEALKEPCKNVNYNGKSNKSVKTYLQDIYISKMENKKQVSNQMMSPILRHANNKLTVRLKRATSERKKKCKCPKLLAGHYEQRTKNEFLTNIKNYTHSRMISTCKHISQWNGKLCKTGDFKSDTKTLHVFEESPSLQKKNSPFKGIKDGKFVTKKKGTYLVYAQVSFYDSKEFQQMKVVHRKKSNDQVIQEYACVRGLRNIDKNVNNTCSITALYFLDKGDYLTIELFDTDLNLNFSTDNTFFGAILLR
ncbi:uncharacterized protein LOC132725909 [Ruditapes philippinarum]|uniref:uncharacterized protein LOC132725909 n=1 Tax=Ruditapes philippinarum TaxID=129788 RepID=UPI00295A873A|nr:uncharacterized protein LOC132725909 [Ruditapes philippinarum]